MKLCRLENLKRVFSKKEVVKPILLKSLIVPILSNSDRVKSY